jgi:hypothetical protein
MRIVGPNGFELEAFTRRLSRVPQSRAQRGTSLSTNLDANGRPEWIRTIDLFRVNLPLIEKRSTYTVSSILSTRVLQVSQVEITGRNHRYSWDVSLRIVVVCAGRTDSGTFYLMPVTRMQLTMRPSALALPF